MAGNSSGWVKVPTHKNPKGKMFVSLAAVKAKYGDMSNAEAQAKLKTLQLGTSVLAVSAIMSLATNSVQPGGQAKGALPKVPAGWANDARAQALIEQQAERGSMMRAGTPAERAFNAAFLDANEGFVTPVSESDAINKNIDGYSQLISYTGSNYGRDYNDPLWATAADPATRAMSVTSPWIQKLQELALSAVAPFDMTVTRAVVNDHPLARWAEAATVGDSYINKGFDSSSINPDISVFGNDVRMRMLIPKGARGLSVNAIFGHNDREQEWLVPANGSWTVTGKHIAPDGKLEITVALVDQRDFDGNVAWP